MPPEQALSDYLKLSAKTSTFVSIDVVGSTQIKTGQNEQDIIYTFLAYHKLVSDLAYTHHGEVITITGDGLMCRFQRAEDAAELAHDLLMALAPFNKKQNHLTQPMSLRIGVHTGEVYESDSLSSGQMISKTLDIAAKLQQKAPTNHAFYSESTVLLLGERAAKFQRLGWDAALGIHVYDGGSGAAEGSPQGRMLPSPARVLIIESELSEMAKLSKTLFGSHYDPFTVFNQNQASLALGTWPPHLVLLSLDLPWETGWDFLTHFRGDAQMSKIPLVAMSYQTNGEAIQKSFKNGANGFLKKPLDEQQILKRIEMVLREFYL
jgi:class 3 adenylate cyclase/CheY-like chemotaxis protein